MALPTWYVIVPPALFLAVCAGLLGESILHGGVLVGQAWRRRWGRQRLVLIRQRGAEVSLGRRRVLLLSWQELLPLGGGLFLAAAWHTPGLALWGVILGLSGAWIQRCTARQHTVTQRALHELFLNALRSRYAVAHSLTQALAGALEDLNEPTAPLVLAGQQVLRQLHAGTPLAQALMPFTTLDATVLQRLATVLARADMAAETETAALLGELEEQARHARRLADRAQVTLAATRTTLRVLVVAAVTLAFLCAVLPLWRSYYLARPGAYIAATLFALSGYGYFAFKIKALEDSL